MEVSLSILPAPKKRRLQDKPSLALIVNPVVQQISRSINTFSLFQITIILISSPSLYSEDVQTLSLFQQTCISNFISFETEGFITNQSNLPQGKVKDLMLVYCIWLSSFIFCQPRIINYPLESYCSYSCEKQSTASIEKEIKLFKSIWINIFYQFNIYFEINTYMFENIINNIFNVYFQNVDLLQFETFIQIFYLKESMASQKVIIFDMSKQEVGNPGSNLKKFVKKYKESYKIGLNKQAVDFQKIKKAHLFVIPAPKDRFTPTQIDDLKKYVENGGNLLVFSHEGGDRKNNTNISQMTKKFGIVINSDSVIRTSFYKYFHPKQAYIHNGILNEEVTRVANGYAKQPKGRGNNGFMLGAREQDEEEYQKESKRTGVDFVYVNGASLNVLPPANPILTSGPLTYPCNRPICGVYQHQKSGGKLIVCGSITMFTDEYFDQQENAKIMDFFLKFFFTQEVDFEFSKDDNQNTEYVYVPDIAQIADSLKSCFHQGEQIPKDFTTMFEADLFKYDFDLVPEIAALFAKMQVKHEPLTLIVPQFQTPLLGLAPGVFPPVLKELPNPSLQLFDLDDQFSQQKVRLAQLTNKCEDNDLDYFIRQAGDILGVSDKVKNRSEPKAILKYILDQIVNIELARQTSRKITQVDMILASLNQISKLII